MTEDPPRISTERLDRFREGVRAIHLELDREISEVGPVCEISGRCCRFKEYGHTLFLTQPEAELLVKDAPPPARPLDDGETCPWQDRLGRCSAREARPIGCRVYYCDPRYEPHVLEIGERALNALKRLIVEADLPWNYAPLHRHLGRLLDRREEATRLEVDESPLRVRGQ